ncbi:hypothetical protein MRX96_039944 [Rhipicephalus microplus]
MERFDRHVLWLPRLYSSWGAYDWSGRIEGCVHLVMGVSTSLSAILATVAGAAFLLEPLSGESENLARGVVVRNTVFSSTSFGDQKSTRSATAVRRRVSQTVGQQGEEARHEEEQEAQV